MDDIDSLTRDESNFNRIKKVYTYYSSNIRDDVKEIPLEPSFEPNINDVANISKTESIKKNSTTTAMKEYQCPSKNGYLIITLVLLIIISIFVIIFFLSQMSKDARFKLMNYPTWAPGLVTMVLIGVFTFLFAFLGFIFLNSYKTRRYVPYVLGLILSQVIFLVLSLLFTYSTKTVLIGFFVLIVSLIIETYIIVFLSIKNPMAAIFQIPYALFLIFLTVIVIFMIAMNNV